MFLLPLYITITVFCSLIIMLLLHVKKNLFVNLSVNMFFFTELNTRHSDWITFPGRTDTADRVRRDGFQSGGAMGH